MDLPILDVSHKQNHSICDCVWLLSLSIMNLNAILLGHVCDKESVIYIFQDSLVAPMVESAAMHKMSIPSLGKEDPLEKEMATHSSILAWKIPWMQEPGRVQSMGLQRVGHD